jgi:hypothetical protein
MHRRVPSARCSATRTAQFDESGSCFSCLRSIEPNSSLRSLAERVVLPSSFGGTHGVLPFAVLLPQRVSRHLCRPGPTCRSRHSPDSIYFRRVDRTRPVGFSTETRKGRVGSGARDVRLLGFTPVCGPRPRLSSPRAAFLPWDLPLSGFADTRFVHPAGLDPDLGSSASGSCRPLRQVCPIRSWASAILSTPSTWRLLHRCSSVRDGSSPPSSSALQRLEGTDAWIFRTFVRKNSLFEVLHRP